MPFQMSTAMTERKAIFGSVSQLLARKFRPIPRRKVFSMPIFGFMIDLKIMPTISAERTQGRYMTARWKFSSFTCLVSRTARARPSAFLTSVVTTVNRRVLVSIRV